MTESAGTNSEPGSSTHRKSWGGLHREMLSEPRLFAGRGEQLASEGAELGVSFGGGGDRLRAGAAHQLGRVLGVALAGVLGRDDHDVVAAAGRPLRHVAGD